MYVITYKRMCVSFGLNPSKTGPTLNNTGPTLTRQAQPYVKGHHMLRVIICTIPKTVQGVATTFDNVRQRSTTFHYFRQLIKAPQTEDDSTARQGHRSDRLLV